MSDINVLWVDDDSSQNKVVIDKLMNEVQGIKLFTVKSCEESENLLKTIPVPQWAIIDLKVLQGNWRDERKRYFQVPGIEYIRYLNLKYKDNIKIYAFSIMVNQEIEDKVREAGGIEAFVKSNISLAGVLRKIKEHHSH